MRYPRNATPSGTSLAARVDFYTDKRSGPGCCWVWTAATDRFGYGIVGERGKKLKAHRAAWLAAGREIPAGMFLLHSCDNPSCVNVDHLRLGTLAENNADRDVKGRQARGERARSAKLDEESVRAIRSDNRRIEQIAADYGVVCSTIAYVKSGKTWGHVQ